MMLRKRIKDTVKRCYYAVRMAALSLLLPLARWRRPVIHDGAVRKILVIRLDRLGDLALTLPLVAAVKRRWPSAELTLLCREATAPLATAQPDLDHILTLPHSGRHAGRKAIGWPLPASLVRHLRRERYDLVIDPFSGEELGTAWLAWRTGARWRLGFSTAGRGLFFTHPVAPDRGRSFMAQQRTLLAAVDIELPATRGWLAVTDDERRAAERRLRESGLDPARPIIGIHPGGYYPTQRWPLSRYLELAKRLDQQASLQVVFFGTRAEERLIAQVGTMFGAKAAVFFGLELREFVALLSRCRLVVCNNSGPLHIATALGVPTVSTMGPTDPIRWWPEGDEHLVVRKPLWCSPCEEGVCPLGTHDCLMSISVDEMLAAVSEQLTGRPLALPTVVADGRR